MDPIHPQSADNSLKSRMQKQEVDYTGGHPAENKELGGPTPGSAYLYLGGVERQEDLYFCNQPIQGLTSETSEQSKHLAQDLSEDQSFGGEGKVQGRSGICNIKERSSEMSSREFIQRRKCKLEERSLSWDVLDTEGFQSGIHEDNGSDMVEVKLEKAEGNQHKHMNVILYKMEEDESRLWSEGHSLSRYTGHDSTQADDRMRRAKLYRRAQSENLVSYLQGSIRALTRSASESSDSHRQVTRLSLQGMGRSHSTDHLLEGVGKMVSSVHALMCTSIQVQEITKNSNGKEKERLLRSRGPPKRIYQLDALSKENLSDTEEQSTLSIPKDAGLDGDAEEGTLWNIGTSENAKPPQDTPPSTEVVKGVFSEETSSSEETKLRQSDSEEDKVLTVADARRAFEASGSSKGKAAASQSRRGTCLIS